MSRSTWIHLRLPFSFFLLPVFFFALSESSPLLSWRLFWFFIALVLFIFPASNGYNGLYDKDTESVGGIEKPPPVASDLLFWTLIFEMLGLGMLAAISAWWALALFFLYGIFSKLYSHPSIRLKRYPWVSLIVVSFFQGTAVYLSVRLTFIGGPQTSVSIGALISYLLIAGSYPISQIYQHAQDRKRGDQTLSLELGYRGTFIWCLANLTAAFSLLVFSWGLQGKTVFVLLSLIPSALIANNWAIRVKKDPLEANFRNTHRFMLVSAGLSNFAFCCIWLYWGLPI